MKTLCVIIPAFNEAENLPALRGRLAACFDRMEGRSCRALVIDDHSDDGSPEALTRIAREDPRFGWLRLSRRSGSHIAIAAGLEHCDSDLVLMMSADLQDPPELIPRLLDEHAKGAQIVWAVREGREKESLSTRLFSHLYYWLMNRLTDLQMPPSGADMFLADRVVVNAFREVRDHHLSVFAILSWLGFRQSSVGYVKQTRRSGRSKWTLAMKVQLLVDSIASFSYLPLRCITLTGFLCAAAGFLWALWILAHWFTGRIVVMGWTGLMVAILLTSGIQMMMLGVLGEYLWRSLEESRRRPRYFIESSSSPPPAS